MNIKPYKRTTNGAFSFRTDILIHETMSMVPSNTHNLNVDVPDARDIPGAPDVPDLLISPGELVLVQPVKAMQNAVDSIIAQISP